jgi:succinate dehydrogenase / fumarate reductase, cytochrome b subunit
MLRWLGSFLASSIGKKALTALTGLLLVGFVVAHLAGNLLLLKGDQGRAFELYAQKLHDLGPLLIVAELGLLALFGTHIAFALRATLQNRRVRNQPYAHSPGHGGRTFASASMPLTGSFLLLFLVVHLVNFRFDDEFKQRFAEDRGGAGASAQVLESLSDPLLAGVYLLAFLALGLHLSHGIQSALQTLGAHHPRYTPVLRRIGFALAGLLALGFSAISAYAFWRA